MKKTNKKVKTKVGLGWIKGLRGQRHELARPVMGTIFLVYTCIPYIYVDIHLKTVLAVTL